MKSTYQIQLNNGQAITFTAENFDSDLYTKMLNAPNNQFVNVGGNIINKNIITAVVLVPAETEPQA